MVNMRDLEVLSVPIDQPEKYAIARQAFQRVRLFFAGLAMCLAAGAGCGGDELDRIPVHGTVMRGGQPLVNGIIHFMPEGDHEGPAVNAEIKLGHYEFDRETGPVAGPHRVIVLLSVDTKGGGMDPEAVQRELAEIGKYEWEFSVNIPSTKEFEHNLSID